MEYLYYPGCTLKNKAKDLDLYARKSAEALGVTLTEVPEWQCCGGVYPMGRDEIATKLSSVRALKAAAERGVGLVTVCAACHNVIKQVNDDMKNDEYVRTRVNNYLADGAPYEGQTEVLHLLEVLRDRVGFDRVKEKVVSPLSGAYAAYYGCLLLRPSGVMAFDDPENPTVLEDLLSALGAKTVFYARRNECCGAYAGLENEAVPKKRAEAIFSNAKAAGADTLATACPLCYYNLKKHAPEGMRVVYFTELLAEALGVK